MVEILNEDDKKYLEKYYMPEFSAYDFLCLFCSVYAGENRFTFKRDELLKFIKYAKKEENYASLLSEINLKSNGIFDYSEELEEAYTELKFTKFLYTISPEKDDSIWIYKDIPAREIVGKFHTKLTEMIEFVHNFNSYQLNSDEEIKAIRKRILLEK